MFTFLCLKKSQKYIYPPYSIYSYVLDILLNFFFTKIKGDLKMKKHFQGQKQSRIIHRTQNILKIEDTSSLKCVLMFFYTDRTILKFKYITALSCLNNSYYIGFYVILCTLFLQTSTLNFRIYKYTNISPN